jgi:sterol desaturase/sphingolipid hydroxylase (fatty acid hydroxylase superfamily)
MTQYQQFFLEHEATFRLACFVILLLLFLVVERIWPRRLPDKNNHLRRFNNIILLGINFLAARFLVPLATYQLAIIASEKEFGLFNIISVPLIVNVICTIVIFDLLIYIQHVVFHKFEFLWRIHRVHHTDLEVDVTTAVRFHPFEIVMSLFYKLAAVYLVGPVAFAIVLYEILLNAAALFTHSNILINEKVDVILRRVFVTPDMHRIHHSVVKRETDSNYGNILSFWDRIFRTYRLRPEAGYDNMEIGLYEFRDIASGQCLQLLKNPFTTSK